MEHFWRPLVCLLILCSLWAFIQGDSGFGKRLRKRNEAVPDITLMENATAGVLIPHISFPGWLNSSTKCRECWSYEIMTPTKYFCMDRDSAQVRLIRPLDNDTNDGKQERRIFIRGLPKTPAQSPINGSFSVSITDIDDNLPELNLLQPLIIISTQGSPNLPFYIRDPDFAQQAGNLSASIVDTTFSSDFVMTCNQAAGNQTLKCVLSVQQAALTKYEDRHAIYIPLQISKDNIPSVLRFLPVQIQTSPGLKDSHSTIHVFKYDYTTGTRDIGSVYPQGLAPGNYRYQPKNSMPDGFGLLDNGNLTLDFGRVRNGSYDIEVTVTNQNDDTDKAAAYLTVDITHISRRQLEDAGSIRLQNVAVEDFLRPLQNDQSQYDMLRKFLAEKLHYDESEVAIFSVMPEGRKPEILQVHFTVVGERRSGTYLNGILSTDKEELENALGLGVKAVQFGVSDCVFENCGPGCSNAFEADGYRKVSAENFRFFGIAVKARTSVECETKPKKPGQSKISCSPNPCFNGGLCHDTALGVFCECRQSGLGSFCQGRMRTFTGDRSYAWLDPIKPCEYLFIQFYFTTEFPENGNAVLAYNGPTAGCDPRSTYCTRDFLLLYISGGSVLLEMNLGDNRTYSLQTGANVRDGRWHRVEALLHDRKLKLTIDDTDSVQTEIQGDFEQLNVNAPLQLGGLMKDVSNPNYPPSASALSNFQGCIRDFHVNGFMLDLENPAHEDRSQPGCTCTDRVCQPDQSAVCKFGLCVSSIADQTAKCSCDIGYSGERCDNATSWHHFLRDQYLKYESKSGVLDKIPAGNVDIEMLIKTDGQNKDGVVFHAPPSGNIQLKLSGGNLTYHSMHFSAQTKSISSPTLHDAEAYHVRLVRRHSSVMLSLDSGQSVAFNKLDHSDFHHPKQFSVGADANGQDGFQGCIAHMSVNGHPVPLPYDSLSSEIERITPPGYNVPSGCPYLATCSNGRIQCSQYQECQDFWKGPFCTCAPRSEPIFDWNGDWIGCTPPPGTRLGITTEALVVILVCALLLLLLILLLLICCCRCRRHRKRHPFHSLPPSTPSELRETLGEDDPKGAGEKNESKYDIDVLKVPILPPDTSRSPSAGSLSDGGPADETRVCSAEAPTGSVGTLSTLPSEEDEADFDPSQVRAWGPKFARLAKILR